MTKKYYRYFGGLLNAQERWLNKMAKDGYRLICTEKLMYEFEQDELGKVQYCIEFIGHKSVDNVKKYCSFLEGKGYKVFFKNINLNYSIGKIRYRPWAEKGERLATNATTFNRELLIIEKENDGKSFELHVIATDKIKYYVTLRNAWIWSLLGCVLLTTLFVFSQQSGSLILGIFTLSSLVAVVVYQIEVLRCKHNEYRKE